MQWTRKLLHQLFIRHVQLELGLIWLHSQVWRWYHFWLKIRKGLAIDFQKSLYPFISPFFQSPSGFTGFLKNDDGRDDVLETGDKEI